MVRHRDTRRPNALNLHQCRAICHMEDKFDRQPGPRPAPLELQREKSLDVALIDIRAVSSRKKIYICFFFWMIKLYAQ